MHEAARPATASDLPTLVELSAAGRDELSVMRGGEIWRAAEARPDPLEPAFRAALDDPAQTVLVATIDDTPVGYAVGRWSELRDGRRLGVVDDLFVDEGARGVGMGEALMDVLLAWFGEQGCAGIDATALPGHRATKNFFERSGFTARKLVMHRDLARGDAEAHAADGSGEG